MRRSPPAWRDLGWIFLIGFAARLILAYATRHLTLFADMAEYDVRARWILEDGTLLDAWRGPGYPLLLAGLYWLPFDDIATARFANVPLGALMAVLTTMLAATMVARTPALIAGLIVAVYPGLVLSSAYLMPEGLYTCLMLVTLILASRTTPFHRGAAGVAAGLAAMTRSLGLSLVVTVVGGMFWQSDPDRSWLRRLAPGLLAATTFLLTITPWLIHTTRVSGGPMLDSNSAWNMLVGHNPRSTGRLEIEDLDWMQNTYLFGYPDEATRNRWAVTQSVAWAAGNPGTWLRLAVVKVGYLWGLEGREHAWLYGSSWFGARSSVVVWLWGVSVIASFPALALMALAGAIRPGLTSSATGRHIIILLALVTLLHVASFGESRFHLPLVPLLAALGVRLFESGPAPAVARRAAGGCVAVLLIGAWWTHLPLLWVRLAALAAPEGWKSGLPY